MYLSRIEITNFRNLQNLTLKPSSELNILVGENSVGKTNFIEALSLLVSTKSFKAQRETDLISWEKDFARVFGKAGSTELEIIIKTCLPAGKGGEKQISLNNQDCKVLDAVGVISAVLFTPTDLEMLRDSPAQRRRYLDILISKISRKYLYELAQYHQVLKNRNRVLFFLKEGREKPESLEAWDNQLISLGSEIEFSRKNFIDKLRPHLKEYGQKILGFELSLRYQTAFIELSSPKLLREEFQSALKNNREEEVARANSLFGPHRDDFSVWAHPPARRAGRSKEFNLGIFGSRGELRGSLLALKMSELSITQEEKKDKAILLLDDVLSELDEKHQKHLLELVRDNQTFITTTNLNLFPAEVLKKATVFEVREGNISQFQI